MWCAIAHWHQLHHGQSPWNGEGSSVLGVSGALMPSTAERRSNNLPFPPPPPFSFQQFHGILWLMAKSYLQGHSAAVAPPLGPLIVLPAGPEPNRLHKGAAGGISLLALIIRCSLKHHGRAQRPPLTSVVLPLSTSLVLSFPLYVSEGVLPSPSCAPLLAAPGRLICVCRPCHTSSTGLWNMHN